MDGTASEKYGMVELHFYLVILSERSRHYLCHVFGISTQEQ